MSPYQISRGTPDPCGTTAASSAINFSLFSAHATEVLLLCYHTHQLESPILEIPLEKSGDFWHIQVEGLPPSFAYGFKISGSHPFFDPTKILIDPYAKKLISTPRWGLPQSQYLSLFSPETPFDWEGVTPSPILDEDWIIYEMHVRGFTAQLSSSQSPGTFQALIKKIPHLKALGVTAIELLPIFAFDECDHPHFQQGGPIYNYWGYAPLHFFAIMSHFSSSHNAIKEFKSLVKELHRNNIRVILDVVYNHTAENGVSGKTFSFKSIDPTTYYLFSSDGSLLNFSGCGNSFNSNHPQGLRLILDSLTYWAEEMHVDGFRFDLASALTRDQEGTPLSKPPLIEAIENHPVLSQKKLIAEPWDAVGLYQVGSFPGSRFCEWNGRYRDVVRNFIKGTDGFAGPFATALCGSQDLYGTLNKSPLTSINFITAHDGFSLKDLVSYNQKHNLENLENNQDGMNDNCSWNCGEEGETENQEIMALRLRQMKNFLTALFVSLGTPMLLMGDEYGHTKKGNNNPWCHDSSLNWFLWDELEKNQELFLFCQQLISLRKTTPSLRKTNFFSSEEVSWHGVKPLSPDWEPSSRLVAYQIHEKDSPSLFIAFYAGISSLEIALPSPPPESSWHVVIDTKREKQDEHTVKESYTLSPFSSIILCSR